ncbi:MAG: DUF1697 domain-containing protein [Pyrinomonadaceae bacterium]
MRYVALLRGINVTGKNMIKMETLRTAFESLGFEDVKSYINSGNLIFNVSRAHVSKGIAFEKELSTKIHDAIQKEFGFDISVMIRSMAEIEEIVAWEPFKGQFESHKDVHVFFLNEKLTDEQVALLLEQGNENELFAIRGRHIACLLKIHITDSAVGKGFIDKKLKVAATGRNWRTVNKLLEY